LTDQAQRPFDIVPVTIEEEMKRSYLDYAMSVIVARALPDVRDGLKPVHRRILYGMQDGGFTADKPYRKSARIVGEVMGKYHPHGDQSIYDAMVRMTQPFAMRLPLLDGQGNFGSMDGDQPAAMRYTEIRLARSGEALLEDIDKDTVDFRATYDESAQEPTVLPAGFPNLLVNGANGIAVGMATNIPPHNLGEVIDACCAYIDDPGVTLERLFEIVPGPDFPTGGLILGRSGARAGLMTGRGSVVMRGRVRVEEIRKDRNAIIVSEIPYQVNKSAMVEKIAEAVRDKRIEGVSELRDESDRDGVRVVIELKRDAVADVVLNQIYRFSPLQTSFGVNMLALNAGRPELMTLRDMIVAFVSFRQDVVVRRTRYLLAKARDRAHVLVGLAIAVANIDEVMRLIRSSPEPGAAREALMARDWPAATVASLIALIDDPRHKISSGNTYRLSETQARAILDLRLQRLTALGRDEITDEMKEIAAHILNYLDILGNHGRLMSIVREELVEMKTRFSTPRRTEIVEIDFEQDDEDLIQREDMVVTVSHRGYVKRTALSTYRTQKRGGKGLIGASTREDDFVTQVFSASTHTPLLVFSNLGRVYKLKVWRIPEGDRTGVGKPLNNLLPLAQDEKIATVMPLPEDEKQWAGLDAMFATAKGSVRRNSLSDFTQINQTGKIAMKFEDEDVDDRLISVATCFDADDILLATHAGKCVRFPVADVRVFQSRSSTGVRGMKLAADDAVISMSILAHSDASTDERDAYLRYAGAQRRIRAGETDVQVPSYIDASRAVQLEAGEQFVLTVTENGFGKRTSSYEYRVTNRGGSGIINIETSERNGSVVAAFPVEHSAQIMLVTNGGQVIRVPVDDIRIAGRNTQGVTLFRTGDGERVVSVARLSESGGENGEAGPAGEVPGE
jgi:DNA gyrase subunit A